MRTGLIVATLIVALLETRAIIRRDDSQELLARGLEHSRSGRLREAERDLQVAVSLSPTDPYSRFCLAMVWAQQSPIASVSVRDFANGATIQVRHGRGRVAAALESVLLLAPTEDAALHNLGWLRVMGGDISAGRRSFERAIEAAPSDPLYRVSLGLLLERAGAFSEAQVQYAQAISTKPDLIYSAFFGDLLTRSSRLAHAAITDAEKILAADPTDPIHSVRMAKLLLFRGRIDESAALARLGVSTLPNLGAAWLVSGDTQLYAGRHETARRYYARALFLDPGAEVAQSLTYTLDRPPRAGFWRSMKEQARVSPHAGRVRLHYRPSAVLENDLLPLDLTEYTAPLEKAKHLAKLARSGP